MRASNVKQKLLSAAICSCFCMLTNPASAAPQSPVQMQAWSIKASPLDQALRSAMKQGNLTISYTSDLVANKQSRGVSGAHTPADALRHLLDGTDLIAESLGATTFVLRAAHNRDTSPTASADSNGPTIKNSRESLETPQPTDIDEVVVTGTRIRGAQPSSPLLTISQEEMRTAGHSSLGDVIRSIPANFNGGQNPGVQTGAGGIGNQNITGGSSLNLRGLGADATLTLLNGARLPYDGFSQATDVAAIPVAAIDRFEVLLDGASAIYGSDAVAGVANIVLKRNYDGAELTARYGTATPGGYEQTQFSAVAGQTWETGSLLLAGETSHGSRVLASDRDYLSYISDVVNPDLVTIYPKLSQDGVLLSGHQELGSQAELAVDAFYTKRSMDSRIVFSRVARTENRPSTTIYGISPSVRLTLPHEWSMRTHAFVGEDKTRTDNPTYSIATGSQTGRSSVMYRNRSEAAGIEFEGAVFSLAGGEARASLGAGWRKAEYENRSLLTGATAIRGSNANRYAYSEVLLPIVGEDQGVPFVQRLSLNGALRYDHYNNFGDSTTPKIGVLWSIVPSIDFRASWGRSFKAPLVDQQYQTKSAVVYSASAAGILDASSAAAILVSSGGNERLGAERARVVTAGFVLRPSISPGASIDLGWFDIDYSDRVVNPIPVALAQYGQILENPSFNAFITPNPTRAQVDDAVRSARDFYNLSSATFNPDNVVAIFDNSYFNAASQRVRGIDVDARYVISQQGGSWQFNAGGSWITDSDRKVIDGTPAFPTAGAVSFPPRFKGRAGASWTHANASIAATINHLGGVLNTRLSPAPKGQSMTTLDLVFDYAADSNFLGGLGFNVAVTNAFNQRPPYILPSQPYYVSYDSTNYSALGRTVSLSVTKRF